MLVGNLRSPGPQAGLLSHLQVYGLALPGTNSAPSLSLLSPPCLPQSPCRQPVARHCVCVSAQTFGLALILLAATHM